MIGLAREQALSVMVELSRWIGKAPFHNLLESVRTAQKTEFEKLLAEREESVRSIHCLLVFTIS